MKKQLIECDDCNNTDENYTLDNCPICYKDLCDDCYNDHIVNEHFKMLLDFYILNSKSSVNVESSFNTQNMKGGVK